jgi:hypothetical protein
MADVFLRQLISPFVALAIFLLAHYISRPIIWLLPEGRVKRFLTKPRSTRSEFFERADARMFALFRRLLRRSGSK